MCILTYTPARKKKGEKRKAKQNTVIYCPPLQLTLYCYAFEHQSAGNSQPQTQAGAHTHIHTARKGQSLGLPIVAAAG